MNNYSQARYFEKTLKESHINIFRSLEIENYLKQLLKKKEFNLHSYRLNFSNSVLQILISAYKKTTPHRKNNRFETKKTELVHRIKSKNILKALNRFTNNKLHIVFKVLNLKNHSLQNRLKTTQNLSRFRVPEIEDLHPIITNQKDSAKLLGTFLAEYLKTTKRHNFFFNSLSKGLKLMIKRQDSKIEGMKILIKGRLNNAARSRNKLIKLGTIPLMTESRDIDYSESVAFTSNGTIGVKIWISHKKPQSTSKTTTNRDKTSTLNLKNF